MNDVEVITGAFQTGGLGVGIAARADSMVHKQLATANIDAEVDSLIRHVRREAGKRRCARNRQPHCQRAPCRIVEFRSGGVPLFQDPAQRLLLKVSKSAIEAYSRGDMDLAAFRKKAVWQTL